MKTPVLIALALAFCGMLACAAADAATPADRRPNLLFLLTDDQTIGAVGCYGNDQILTPHLDRLARQGLRFTNHYNTTAICMASRASIMTGMYEYKTGCNFSHGKLAADKYRLSYPLLLRRSGYFTGFAGKIGFEVENRAFDRFAEDFDGWAGAAGMTAYQTAKNPALARYAHRYPHSSRAYAAWAGDFLHAAKKSGKPFCLSISFKAPHLPFTPDPTDERLYQSVTFKKPANYGTANAAHLASQAKAGRQFHGYRFWITDYNESLANYDRLISGVDTAVGMIRKALADEGLADNTVILFTSDNGYSCGAHGFGGKVLPYEEASKSPLIIYDPRLPARLAGRTCSALTANIDMAPTMLAMAGLRAPDNMDGHSLLALLADPTAKLRSYLPLFNFWGAAPTHAMAIVTPHWKYIYWYYPLNGMKPTEELFDLEPDRLEMVNRAADPACADVLDRMRQAYDRQFDHLRRNAVHDHRYAPYRVLFDRHASVAEKIPYLQPTPKPTNRRKR